MPRKTPHLDGHLPSRFPASMRPRPDAAENERRRAERQADRRASMRPRPDAAENCDNAVAALAALNASMRPRPDAAENPMPDAHRAVPAAVLQ